MWFVWRQSWRMKPVAVFMCQEDAQRFVRGLYTQPYSKLYTILPDWSI
jgi:hypothetical protein